jgi:hypothetical protein
MRSFEDPAADPPQLPFPGDGTNPRDFPDSYVYDAIDISGKNLMIDHVSTSYATDETISANEQADNVTIQYSNISQGQNYPQADAEGGGNFSGHALGSLLQAGSNARISVHHNLYAHQKGRLPRVGSELGTGAYNDFRNNVFYNWLNTAGTGASRQPSFNNFVSNFYLAGPGGDDPVGGSSTDITTRSGGTNVFSGNSSSLTSVYQSGNLRDSNNDGDANDGVLLTNSNFPSSSIQANPLWSGGQPTYTGVTDSANDAFVRVLKYMGANWWTRKYEFQTGNVEAIDTVDERLIHETYTGTGKIMAWADNPFNDFPDPAPSPYYDPYDPNEGAEWRQLLSFRADPVTGDAPFNRDASWDTDGDGMPNAWELQHGLDPNVDDHNGDFDSDGYTNLEEYINELAAWPAPGPIAFNGATNNRYAQITNWDVNPDPLIVGVWQPSRYDTAEIDNGTVVVDAVGQHAGNILLSTHVGDHATLNITSGWLTVEDAPQGMSDGVIVIGDNPSATATLNLLGGTLTTNTLMKGPGGTFNLQGGVLYARTIGFDLENHGGTLAPGSSIGSTTIVGNFTTESGAVEIELAAVDSFDSVAVSGSVTLGGDLIVKLLDGYLPDADSQLIILTGNTISGSFANLSPDGRLNVSGTGATFRVTISSNQVTLSDFLAATLPDDYNGDGVVDAADYIVWRKTDGTQAGYSNWRTNFGRPINSGSTATAAVPEPLAAVLLLIGIVTAICRGRPPCCLVPRPLRYRSKSIRSLHSGASFILSLLAFTASATAVDAQLKAFPTAEGFGAVACGGRGGSVYHVTNLNDSGSGSFRDAISQSNRTVVFDVSGVINISSQLVFSSNVTVAGQTATNGIAVYGDGVSLSHRSNNILRNITFRAGIGTSSDQKTINMTSTSDIILDHVSIGWSRYDNLGITKDSGQPESSDKTIQNCLVHEAINDQRAGGIIDSSRNITFARNLFTNNDTRNPKGKGDLQFINNVIYNYGKGGYVGGHSSAIWHEDLINN